MFKELSDQMIWSLFFHNYFPIPIGLSHIKSYNN